MTCKCKGCEERTLGCHDNCQAYAEYKAYREQVRKQERMAKMNTTVWTQARINETAKNHRIKNGQGRGNK